MWELDHKESWVPKNWCFWTVVLEKTLESPLECKEIKPVNPKGNQSWMFIGRTDAEAESTILWSPDAKNWLFRKDSDAVKDWKQEEKGMIEDEMVGWHHWLDGHDFEQDPGVRDGQGSLEHCSPWGCKELDMAEWLNWTQLNCLHQVTDGGHLVSAIFFSHWKFVKVCYMLWNGFLCVLSHVWLFATLWTVACQAPLSMGFPR